MLDHEQFLLVALDEARLARDEGSAPFGAALVDSGGQILGRGRSRVFTEDDSTAHAEIQAIRESGRAAIGRPSHKAGNTLYTTGEPCLMCFGSVLVSRIDAIVWAANSVLGSSYDEVAASNYWPDEIRHLRVTREPFEWMRVEVLRLQRDFFAEMGEPELARSLAEAAAR